ncbi:hypothetical protein KIN20_014262 [Parelaphostrongylus tenuis]|uniref:Uncharacterized protein n=1 Tax=Parelaphostrongylus tenuis TaxID=148309 RepID=A0AAD5QRQ0_PARTN|nr:hypothetical protein KIN20_014262 [Parelaphostrongylus tenuis]
MTRRRIESTAIVRPAHKLAKKQFQQGGGNCRGEVHSKRTRCYHSKHSVHYTLQHLPVPNWIGDLIDGMKV